MIKRWAGIAKATRQTLVVHRKNGFPKVSLKLITTCLYVKNVGSRCICEGTLRRSTNVFRRPVQTEATEDQRRHIFLGARRRSQDEVGTDNKGDEEQQSDI